MRNPEEQLEYIMTLEAQLEDKNTIIEGIIHEVECAMNIDTVDGHEVEYSFASIQNTLNKVIDETGAQRI